MKRSAREQGVLTDGGKDEGTGNWIVILSPNDLFRLDVDFAKLSYKPLLINRDDHYDSVSSDSSSKMMFSLLAAHKTSFWYVLLYWKLWQNGEPTYLHCVCEIMRYRK